MSVSKGRDVLEDNNVVASSAVIVSSRVGTLDIEELGVGGVDDVATCKEVVVLLEVDASVPERRIEAEVSRFEACDGRIVSLKEDLCEDCEAGVVELDRAHDPWLSDRSRGFNDTPQSRSICSRIQNQYLQPRASFLEKQKNVLDTRT